MRMRFVPIGVEMRILRDGGLVYSRIFPSSEAALAWAGEERKELIEQGWLHSGDRLDGGGS
jgi:hypothetical protein